jgi:hypothetical protein
MRWRAHSGRGGCRRPALGQGGVQLFGRDRQDHQGGARREPAEGQVLVERVAEDAAASAEGGEVRGVERDPRDGERLQGEQQRFETLGVGGGRLAG